MNVNLNHLIHVLKSFPIKNIPKDTRLIYEKTGFRLEGESIEETEELNKKWSLYIDQLNKISFYEEFLTVSEIAEHLKISTASVHKILKEQDQNNPTLPYIDTSVGKRIRTIDYIRFLEQCYIKN